MPIPKRKTDIQANTNVIADNTPQLRQIIEVQEKVTIDRYKEFMPIPKRKKGSHSDSRDTIKFIGRSELKNEVENENNTDNKRSELAIATITDSIRSKFAKCWSMPDGIARKENLNIKVNVLLSNQGEIVIADVVDNDSYQKNSLFRAVADSALRAVYKCSPLTDLPKEHYHIWREITLDFILNEQV